MQIIMSIDFDYFFPDPTPYDWGHNENYSAGLNAALWKIREDNVKLYDRSVCESKAINDFVADKLLIRSIYDNVTTNTDKLTLTVADSHKDIISIIHDESIIYNYDAHHDCYNASKDINCGNWVYHLMLKGKLKRYNYHIVYPWWRKLNKERSLAIHEFKVYYDKPTMPPIDQIFICKSSAFTPTWSNNEWLELLRETISRFECEYYPNTTFFKCPTCGKVSWNYNDIRNRYCAKCSKFID